MNKQMHYVIKDIENYKLRSITTVLFVIIIALCCGIFSTQFVNSYNEYRYFEDIQKASPVYFSSYQLGNTMLHKDTLNYLSTSVSYNGPAYSYISDFFDEDGNEYFVALGSFSSFFQLTQKNISKAGIIVGYNRQSDQTNYFLNETTLPVLTVLDKGASFFDIGMGRISLDDKLILVCDFDTLHSLDHSYDTEVLDHLAITRDFDKETESLLSTLHNTRTMMPQNNSEMKRLYQSTYYENLYFLFYYIAMFLLSIIFLFYILKLLIRNNRKEYTIHLIYGAKRKQLFFRLYMYINLLFGLPFIVFFALSGRELPFIYIITTTIVLLLLQGAVAYHGVHTIELEHLLSELRDN